MASFEELAGIQDDDRWGLLLNKIRVACGRKSANIINSTTPGAIALDWAKSTLKNKNSAGDDIAFYVVAKVSIDTPSITIDQIYSANDLDIESHVSAAIDAIYRT